MLKREDSLNIINKYLLFCKRLKIHLYKVYLFGSCANGNINEDSDIDLALVSDIFTGHRIADNEKIARANIKFPLIEPHTFSRKYFEKGDPFIEEIKKTGIEIKLD